MNDPYEWINKNYGTNWRAGQAVTAFGKLGITTGKATNYVYVVLEGERVGRPYHPTEIQPADVGPEVVAKMQKACKPTRSQQRYQDYRNSEVSESFAEWLGLDRSAQRKNDKGRWRRGKKSTRPTETKINP